MHSTPKHGKSGLKHTQRHTWTHTSLQGSAVFGQKDDDISWKGGTERKSVGLKYKPSNFKMGNLPKPVALNALVQGDKNLMRSRKNLKNRPLINKNIFPTDKSGFECFIQSLLLTFPGFLHLYSTHQKLSPSDHTITSCGFSSFLLISFFSSDLWLTALLLLAGLKFLAGLKERTTSSNVVFSSFFILSRKGPFMD